MKLVVFERYVPAKISYKENIDIYKNFLSSSSKQLLYIKFKNGNEYRFVTKEQAKGYGKLYPIISYDEFQKEINGLFGKVADKNDD